jgi:LacI family transcriptional regulator
MKKKSSSHPTLADVARIARVGKATVSRVLNGGKRVSPETLERINDVIQALGYQPSQAARSLKGNGTKAIGLLIPSIADPFFASSAEAVQRIAHLRGYLLMISSTNYQGQMELDHLHSLIRHRVEGILFAPGEARNTKRDALIERLGVPLVSFNHPLRTRGVASVVSDNRAAARKATEHLLGHGCRKIVCLGGESGLYSIRERQRGYAEAMKSAGLRPLLEGEANAPEEVAVVLERYLRQRSIDAVFAVRNRITVLAFQALQKLRIAMPGRVALLGFDDFDLAPVLRPAITVVAQPIDEIASEAANLLFEHLHNRSIVKQAVIRELKTTLILRHSCGCGTSDCNQEI